MKGFKTENEACLSILRSLAGDLDVPDLYFGDNEDCCSIFGESIFEHFQQKGTWFVWFQGTYVVSNKESDILEMALDFAGTPADICTFQRSKQWFAEIRDWS
jgi:hypothetical protein